MLLGALIWLIAAIVLAVIEMLTVDLIFIMLASAAMGAAITSWLLPDGPYNLWIEVGVFAVTSILLLALVRPFFKRKLDASQTKTKTNVYALEGQKVKILNTVTEHSGQVRLSGEVWSARTEEETQIRPGQDAWVERIDGATAVITTQAPTSTELEGTN